MDLPIRTSTGYKCKLQHLSTSVRSALAAESVTCDKNNERSTIKKEASQYNVSYESVRDALRIKRNYPKLFSNILKGERTVSSLIKELF